MITYTPYESELSYTGQYPDMVEFEKPWEGTVQVGQGRGAISKDGKTLQSEGYEKCFALLLRDQSTLESALFHVDDNDLGGREGLQKKIMAEFMRDYLSRLALDSQEKEILLAAAEDVSGYLYPKRMRREEFQARMGELNNNGIIQARFVYGDASRNAKNRIVGSLLEYLGVNVVDDLRVNTGQAHWAMLYKPQESRIYVDARNLKKVLTFPF